MRIYTELYYPRRSPTPIEFTLDLKVEVESLRIGVLLSQPLPPPQYDVLPLRRPAAGTGLDEPGEPHPEMKQTKQGGTFPFQADVDGFLHVNCTRIQEQGGTLSFRADVRVNPKATDTISTSHRSPEVCETCR